ncbi:hypothetical protein OJF2_47220 [Aquisphaera giovannonii]|uniref:Uncharacterized protein n=1 Tax=Aquisphaera giovannonii TaxID=406548 RepID=A0A5B9W679_9BACT|nr:hypothetical protein [Aquisphaera giovannonii]QEH36162.1 hypothetical protein OJF2_47220 [Aquisphaera giovannonii]
MATHLQDRRDPELDGWAKPPRWTSRSAGWVEVLVGVAALSLGWAVVSVYSFLRVEAPHLRPSEGPAPAERPSPLRPLLILVPPSIRAKGLPASELSLAADVRAAEERGGEMLWGTSYATGDGPGSAHGSATDSLGFQAPPGRKMDGWLMRVGWANWLDTGGIPRYLTTPAPPGRELLLEFPDSLAGHPVYLMGYNFDLPSRRFACDDRQFEAIERHDWVKVSGVMRTGSRMRWEAGKPDEALCLGDMTITGIEKVGADSPQRHDRPEGKPRPLPP